jgi:hypothetical protein
MNRLVVPTLVVATTVNTAANPLNNKLINHFDICPHPLPTSK